MILDLETAFRLSGLVVLWQGAIYTCEYTFARGWGLLLHMKKKKPSCEFLKDRPPANGSATQSKFTMSSDEADVLVTSTDVLHVCTSHKIYANA